MKVCECCGHPLPELELLLDLTRMQGKLFVIVKDAGRAGVDAHTIIDRLYDGHKRGRGPNSTNILNVMKCGMQHVLQKHGLKLTCRTGPGARWRLEAI